MLLPSLKNLYWKNPLQMYWLFIYIPSKGGGGKFSSGLDINLLQDIQRTGKFSFLIQYVLLSINKLIILTIFVIDIWFLAGDNLFLVGISHDLINLVEGQTLS